jgi:BlaI family transcriptional regulator, penicillinase repressor
MPNPPKISDAEWEVMRVIWAQSPLAANQVVARLARHDWSPRTVKTMLNRLVNKGALAFEAQGKRYLYRPAVKQDQCVRSESRTFVDRVFGGAAGAMINYFVENESLNSAEIAQLKRMLNRKGRQP